MFLRWGLMLFIWDLVILRTALVVSYKFWCTVFPLFRVFLCLFVVLGSGCFCCNKDFKKWSYLGVTGSPSVKYNFDTLMLTISSINSQSMSNTSWCLLYVPYIIFLSQWVLNKCLVNVQNWVFTVGRRMHALKWSVCSLSIQGCLGQLPELRWDILR